MAATATEMMRLRKSEIGWPLEELWIAGELLTGAQDIEAGVVIVMLDVAPKSCPGWRPTPRASGSAIACVWASIRSTGSTGLPCGRGGTRPTVG